EHDRLRVGDRRQERAREQELLAEDVLLDLVPARLVRLGLDAQELLAVVPLVERLGLVEALVALEADQLACGRARESLGELGLADARGALDEDRLAERHSEMRDERRRIVRQVRRPGQRRASVLE